MTHIVVFYRTRSGVAFHHSINLSVAGSLIGHASCLYWRALMPQWPIGDMRVMIMSS